MWALNRPNGNPPTGVLDHAWTLNIVGETVNMTFNYGKEKRSLLPCIWHSPNTQS